MRHCQCLADDYYAGTVCAGTSSRQICIIADMNGRQICIIADMNGRQI